MAQAENDIQAGNQENMRESGVDMNAILKDKKHTKKAEKTEE